MRKLKERRGFSLAELLIVIAIIAMLAGIAFAFISPGDLSHVEYDRSAEAIATAAQNRLTEIRNTGDMKRLREIGEPANDAGTSPSGSGTVSVADTQGGYRYVFNYVEEDGTLKHNPDIGYILPFGAIDLDLAANYYAIGYQSDTGMVGEVFYAPDPFGGRTAAYLRLLKNDEEKRIAENVGYYWGDVDETEVAFANLPTPQLTISNHEELSLSIFLPEVRQLADYGKQLGVVVSLADAEGTAYKNGLDTTDTAIYATFPLGDTAAAAAGEGTVVVPQDLPSGATYRIVLDTVKQCDAFSGVNRSLTAVPIGTFENWAVRSGAFGKPFLFGENTMVTVTVYCLSRGGAAGDELLVDPTFMPRSASAVFNGWFNDCSDDKTTVDIACGRHLQNLAKLSELRSRLADFAPKAADSDGDGIYEYEKYDLGMADAYTEGSEEVDPHIHKNVKNPTESDGSYYEIKDGFYVCTKKGSPLYGTTLLDINGNKVPGDCKIKDKYLVDAEGNNIPDPLYQSEIDPNTYYEDITEKYVYRSDVQSSIVKANQVNAIDFDCAEWRTEGKPIAFTPINLPYNFYYYGNYLTIKNLYVDAPFYAGLFGYAYHPRLYDILLVNPSVTSQAPSNLAEVYEIGAGGLIGTSRDSSHINNCQVYMMPEADGVYNSDRRVQGECYVGGLIGFCEDEHIENCSASVFTGYKRGATKKVDIVKETVDETGAVDRTIVKDTKSILSHYVGGLIGCVTGDGNITSCYAAGNLTGEYVGGLIGFICEDSDPSGDDYRIDTCYTAGHIEYATEEAAGIVGRIKELSGDVKSALSVYGNYCVVIYGEAQEGGGYVWNGRAPIYGTFKGDGYEWMGTNDQNGAYYDAYLKGTFGDHSYFAGAVFQNNSKNYYIAQRDITYSGTSYLTGGDGVTVEGLVDAIEAAEDDEAALKTAIADAQNKMYYLKKLQALEEMNDFMKEVIKAVDGEPSTDADGNRYVDTHLVGLEQHGVEIHSSTSGYIKVTATQAIHAIYDGTFTDADGKSYTDLKIDYTGTNHPDWLYSSSKIETYTFMGFYNALKTAYKTLMTTPDDAEALAMVERILGKDTGDTSQKFYQDGMFYTVFRTRLFYSLFGDIKNYYEEEAHADKNGELLFRHYRDDYADSGFRRLLCDLGMTDEGRANMLREAQLEGLKTALDALDEYVLANDGIIARWKKSASNQMYKYADTVSGYVTAARTAMKSINDNLGKADYTISELEADIKTVDENLYNLYVYYDTAHVDLDGDGKDDKDDEGNSVHVKDLVDAIDKKGTKDEMRKLRDVLNDYRKAAYLCGASYNSGVDRELDVLAQKLNEGGGNTAELVATFLQNARAQLANDSGHRIKDAEALRNIARGYDSGVDGSTQTDYLGFMYDYGNSYVSSGKDRNPYTNSENPIKNNSYVDLDNGVYNNVFPYAEGAFTKYYPFPLVYGRKLETTGELPLYVLFHYGDWLTKDLWADADPAAIALEQMEYELENMTEYFSTIKSSDLTGNTKTLDNLDAAVKGCLEQVNLTMSDESIDQAEKTSKLQGFGNTVSSWLDAKGLLTSLEAECDAAIKKGNKKEAFQQLKDKLTGYRESLQALIERIDALGKTP